MRIGVRVALTLFVLATIVATAAIVHGLWWRTAEANSRQLAATINRQIVGQVKDEIAGIATQGRSAYWAIRTLFFQHVLRTRQADKREFVFLSQLQAQPSVSWIVLGWPDGDFFAAHKLGDEELEMMEIDEVDGKRQRRVDLYKVFPNDIEFRKRRFEPSDFHATAQPWYLSTIDRQGPHWLEVTDHPTGRRPSLVFAGPVDVYTRREGVLAVMIEHDRLSRFLAGLKVGAGGAAFILTSQGRPVAVPDPKADELMGTRFDVNPLLLVAQEAIGRAIDPGALKIAESHDMRILAGGEAYAVQVSPLAFADWVLATVIPESEFLGAIEATMRRLGLGILMLVIAAVALSAWLARRLIGQPLSTVVGELDHIERFELDLVSYRPSRLIELDDLSGTIHRMASGLAAFRKYLPADLVRTLVSEGIEAKPGGTQRELTILFADVAGFTGLSERLGEGIVPLLGRYLDVASSTLQARDGTIDKFIGDAVMAFWGAPRENPEHAADACRGAVAMACALEKSGLKDDEGRPLGVRIGLNSGDVVVGNIGSETRLNYTVIGDAVNVASRLEGANKRYGTAILIGERTRVLAGEEVIARLVDRVAVFGRARGMKIYELVGLRGEPVPLWIEPYETGIALYTAGKFEAAIGYFEQTIRLRGQDPPAQLMIERCRKLLEHPPATWDAITVLDSK